MKFKFVLNDLIMYYKIINLLSGQSVSAPNRKEVNFTLKVEKFVTCLIWEGRRFHKSIVRWKKQSINLPPVGLILHFMGVLSTLFIIAEV